MAGKQLDLEKVRRRYEAKRAALAAPAGPPARPTEPAAPAAVS